MLHTDFNNWFALNLTNNNFYSFFKALILYSFKKSYSLVHKKPGNFAQFKSICKYFYSVPFSVVSVLNKYFCVQ